MTTKKNRKTYTAEFKTEALKLAERVGVAEAARQLKLYETQIYNWRNALEKKSTTSQREAELAAEVAKLRRQLADQAEDLAILKKAATYFAKNQK
jgi:transposase